VELSARYDEVDMLLVVPIENDGDRAAFRTRPEWLARGSDRVFGKVVQELLDFVSESLLEFETGPDDTFFED
jgi:hypothetical protein